MPTHPLPLTPACVSDWALASRAPRPRWSICLAAFCGTLSVRSALCTAPYQTLLPRHRFVLWIISAAPGFCQEFFKQLSARKGQRHIVLWCEIDRLRSVDEGGASKPGAWSTTWNTSMHRAPKPGRWSRGSRPTRLLRCRFRIKPHHVGEHSHRTQARGRPPGPPRCRMRRAPPRGRPPAALRCTPQAADLHVLAH